MAYKSITAEENIALAKERISNNNVAENTNSAIAEFTARNSRGIDNRLKGKNSSSGYTEILESSDEVMLNISDAQSKDDDNFFNLVGRYFSQSIDLTLSVFEGIVGSIEGIVDAAATLGYWVAKPFMEMAGADSARAESELSSFVQADFLNDVLGYYDSDFIKSIKEYSLLSDMGFAGDVMHSVAENVGQMAPYIISGQAGAALGGTAGKVLGAVAKAEFFLSATGGGVQEALRDGATLDKATVYGLLVGAVEESTELVGGALSNAVGESSVLQRAFGRLADSAAGRKAISYIVGIAGEGFEEMLADIVNPVIKQVYDENALDAYQDEKFVEQTLYDGLIGALMGGVLGASELNDRNQVGEIIRELKTEQQKLSRARTDGNVELSNQIMESIRKKENILSEYGNKYQGKDDAWKEENDDLISSINEYTQQSEDGKYSSKTYSSSMSVSGNMTESEVKMYVTDKHNELYEGGFEGDEKKAKATMDKIARNTGTKLAIVSDIKEAVKENGTVVYRDSNGVIVGYTVSNSNVIVVSKKAFARDSYIELNLVDATGKRMKSKINSAIGTMFHEISHFAESVVNPKTKKKTFTAAHRQLATSIYEMMSHEYGNVFRNFLEDVAHDYNDSFDYDDYVNAIEKINKDEELSEREYLAYTETTANVVEQIALTDERFIEMLCAEESGGIGKKILAKLQNFIKRLGQTEEERKVHDLLKGIEKQYQRAIAAKKTLDTILTSLVGNIADDDETQFSIDSTLQALDFKVNLNDKKNAIVSVEKDGVVYTDADLQKDDFSLVTPEMVQKSSLGEYISTALQSLVNQGKITKAEMETKQKEREKFFADFTNLMLKYRRFGGRLVYEVAGALAFSSVKNNSDKQYSYSVDFATICAKTESILKAMSEKMQEVQRGLTKEEVMKIYTDLTQTGKETPCAYCYVFAKWFGIGSALNKTKKMVELFGKFTSEERTAYVNKAKADVDELIALWREHNPTPSGKKALTNGRVREKLLDILSRAYSNILSVEDDVALTSRDASSDIANELNMLSEELGGIDIPTVERLEELMDIITAYGWITKVENNKVHKFELNTEEERKEFYELLFDLNRTDEFATKYPTVWSWRKALGAGYGKAIMPYSPAILGGTTYAVATKTARENARKRNGFLTRGKEWSADTKKNFNKAVVNALAQKLVGGIRVQSWSDFKEAFLTDWLMTALELESIGAAVQGYSKVFAGVETFSQLGFTINQSLSCRVTTNEKGEKVLEYSVLNGMDIEGAIDILKRFSQAGTIAIGFNDEQLELCLADKNVRMVIPYHASGTKAMDLRTMLNALSEEYESVDYSLYQNDENIKEEEFESGEIIIKKGDGKPFDVSTVTTPLSRLEYIYDTDMTGEEWAEMYANPETRKKASAIAKKHFSAVRGLRYDIIRGRRKNFSSTERKLIEENRYLQNLIKTFTEGEYAGVVLTSDQAEKIFPYEYWDKSVDYDNSGVNSRNFIEYTASLGIRPRFHFIANNQFYWKTLVDRNMYDYNTGKYVEQPSVTLDNIVAEDVGAKAFMDMAKKDRTTTGKVVISQSQAAIERAKNRASLWKADNGDGTFTNRYYSVEEAQSDMQLSRKRRHSTEQVQTNRTRDYSDPMIVEETRRQGKASESYSDITADVLADDIAHYVFENDYLPNEILDSPEFKKIVAAAVQYFKTYGYNGFTYRYRARLKNLNLMNEYNAVKDMIKNYSKAKINEIIFIEEKLFGKHPLRGENRRKFRASKEYAELSKVYEEYVLHNGNDAMNTKKFEEFVTQKDAEFLASLGLKDSTPSAMEINRAESKIRKINADTVSRAIMTEIFGNKRSAAEMFARRSAAYEFLRKAIRDDYLHGRDMKVSDIKKKYSALVSEIRNLVKTYDTIKVVSNDAIYERINQRLADYGVSEGDLEKFGFKRKLAELRSAMVGKKGLLTLKTIKETNAQTGETKTVQTLTPNFSIERLVAFAKKFRAFYNPNNPALFGLNTEGGLVSKVINELFEKDGVFDYLVEFYNSATLIEEPFARIYEEKWIKSFDERMPKNEMQDLERLAYRNIMAFAQKYYTSKSLGIPDFIKSLDIMRRRVNGLEVTSEELDKLSEAQKKVQTTAELKDYVSWHSREILGNIRTASVTGYSRLLELSRAAMEEIIKKVGSYDTVRVNGKMTTAGKEANTAINNYNSRKAHFKKVGWIRNIILQWTDPETIFQMADMYDDNGIFTRLFYDIQEGEMNAMNLQIELKEIYNNFAEKKENRAFIKSLKDKKRMVTLKGKESGSNTAVSVKLTLGEAVSLYLTLRQEDGFRHATENGITFYRDGKKLNLEPITIEQTFLRDENGDLMLDDDGNPIDTTLETFATEYLGADEKGNLTGQMKAYIETIDAVMDRAAKSKGEVDMYFYGEERLLPNYYPLSSDADNFGNKVYQHYSDAYADLVEGFSIVQHRTSGGDNRLAVRGVEDVMQNYMYKIGAYCGLAIPLDSFSQIANRKGSLTGKGYRKTLMGYAKDFVWEKIDDYMSEVLMAVQGAQSKEYKAMTRKIEKMRSRYSRFVLGLNLSSTLKQWAAFPMASLYLNGKAMRYGMAHALPTVFSKREREVMFKYSKAAKLRFENHDIVRAQGVIDSTDTHMSKLTFPLESMDFSIINYAWQAAKYQSGATEEQMQGLTPEQKEARLQKAGKLLDRIIFSTQANSMITSKTAWQRGNVLTKALSMFTADAPKQLSRMMDFFTKWRMEASRAKEAERNNQSQDEIKEIRAKARQNKIMFVKASTATVMSAVIATMAAYAIRQMLDRDDDEEDVVAVMGEEFLSNFLGVIPVGDEIITLMTRAITGNKNYEVSYFAFDMLNDFTDIIGNLFSLVNSIAGGEDFTSQQVNRSIKDAIFVIGQLTGIPTRNIYNIVNGSLQFTPGAQYQFQSLFGGGSYGSDLKKALEKGDTVLAESIVNAMYANYGLALSGQERGVILKLYNEGYDVLPKAVSSSIMIDGEKYTFTKGQRARFTKTYSMAGKDVQSLLSSPSFSGQDNATKAKAIKFIYDYYYDLAKYQLSGYNENDASKKYVFAQSVNISDIAKAYAVHTITEADTDRKGNIIAGSRKRKVSQYIQRLPLNAAQKYLLLAYLGYSVDKPSLVKTYVSSLKISSTLKKTLLAYCGISA